MTEPFWNQDYHFLENLEKSGNLKETGKARGIRGMNSENCLKSQGILWMSVTMVEILRMKLIAIEPDNIMYKYAPAFHVPITFV